MNIKMATNSQVSTTESKKQSKQPERDQNHRYGELPSESGRGENGEKDTGIKEHNW